MLKAIRSKGDFDHFYGYFFMPYCLKRLEGNLWVILNRHYKPLGLAQDAWTTYGDYGVHVHRLGPKTALQLAVNDQYEKYGWLYLYDDGCAPWEDKRDMDTYLEKIKVLMRLVVSVDMSRPNTAEGRAKGNITLLEKYMAYAMEREVEFTWQEEKQLRAVAEKLGLPNPAVRATPRPYWEVLEENDKMA